MIKFIVRLLPILLLLVVFTNVSYAESNPLFDLKNEVIRQNINLSKNNIIIPLPPFSNLIIKPGTFKETVALHVFKGNFNEIKSKIYGQTPFSSYLFLFNTNKGTVVPALSLEIKSYNNYNNTNTYFYPVYSPFYIDTTNVRSWNGNIKVDTYLPVVDSGFIVSANIDLKENDKSLLPQNIAPTAKPDIMQINFLNNSVLQILAIIFVIVLITGVAFLLIILKRKK